MEIKNTQQSVKGDTATENITDIADFMKAEKVIKVPSVKSGSTSPNPEGIKTPGNPAL